MFQSQLQKKYGFDSDLFQTISPEIGHLDVSGILWMIFCFFFALGPELQLHSMSGDLGLPNCDDGDSMAINMALQGIHSHTVYNMGINIYIYNILTLR
jgi:hypothetical protein